MRRSIRSSSALLAAVGLEAQAAVESAFPVLAPWPLVRLIRKENPNDPILRQLLATDLEREEVDGFLADPLAEANATPAPGLIHKYHGRALLITTGACALHCRYCFRREFPYSAHAAGQLHAALEYLRQKKDIHEIILSGGDPLSLSDDRFASLIETLDNIPQLRTIRIHSRFPIAIPQRVNTALLRTLRSSKKTVMTVIHANHPQEIGPDQQTALRALTQCGPLLNQAVLLRGVNDRLEALEDLSHILFQQGVLPYYLHQLDKVRGAAHFSVSDSQAIQLHDQLRDRVPGYLLPKLVREQPGAQAKSALRA